MDNLNLDLLSLGLYVFLVFAVVSAMLGSYFLGPRHKEPATNMPYESGIISTGNARIRFAAHFYLVAMFFVVFDLETVFLFAWASAARTLGVIGFAQACVFVLILFVTLFYLFRTGGLNIGPKLRRPFS